MPPLVMRKSAYISMLQRVCGREERSSQEPGPSSVKGRPAAAQAAVRRASTACTRIVSGVAADNRVVTENAQARTRPRGRPAPQLGRFRLPLAVEGRTQRPDRRCMKPTGRPALST